MKPMKVLNICGKMNPDELNKFNFIYDYIHCAINPVFVKVLFAISYLFSWNW